MHDVRPTRALTYVQLLQISMFWFAINMASDWKYVALGVMEVAAMLVAALTMPIATAIGTIPADRPSPYLIASVASRSSTRAAG